MHNHVHVVVRTGTDSESLAVLRDLKRYGSKALNERVGSAQPWWTKSGSCRQLREEANVAAAIEYVRAQYRPLLVWIDERHVRT